MNLIKIVAAIAVCSLLASASDAQVPQLINYQGRVVVGSTNFDGTGQFRFALVNADGTATYWSNAPDTSPADGVPDSAVSLSVSMGLYSVLLGDAALTNMAVVPATVFTNPDVRLRVWFDDGTHGMQLLSPDQRIAAVGYAMMSNEVRDGAVTTAKIAPGAVGSGQLAPGAASANLSAGGQSAVPAAALVMSKTLDPALVSAGYVNIGSFLSNIGDNWQQKADLTIGFNGRSLHSAVWTGAEMIVWGGSYESNTSPVTTTYISHGSRFNPTSNSWTQINTGGGPTARNRHFAFWTGREMLIYGGRSATNFLERSGGRYNFATNSWSAIDTTNAPAARDGAIAVWTGREMIVWGGAGSTGEQNTGGRYNPATNTWTHMPDLFNSPSGTNLGPTGRYNQLAVWTGNEMIVWGGSSTAGGGTFFNTGARYNPQTNTWTDMSSTNAPAGTLAASVVWTGNEMIVWGGFGSSGDVATGARYNPVSDTWSALPTTNAPMSRHGHGAIWDGKHMVVWGGERGSYLNTGARYDPVLNTWTALPTIDAPVARIEFTAIAAGADMLIFGGRSGSTRATTVFHRDTFLESLSRLVYIYQRP